MAYLTQDLARQYGSVPDQRDEYLPLSGTVFAGSALVWNASGQLVKHGAETTKFAGFALQGGASGQVVQVRKKGNVVLALAAAVALTDIGATVYLVANEDNVFNLTSTSNLPVGKISRVVTAGGSGANEVEVEFAADDLRPL